MTESGVAGPAGNKRLTSIDMLRGLVMVIMARDHVRAVVSMVLSRMFSGQKAEKRRKGVLWAEREREESPHA